MQSPSASPDPARKTSLWKWLLGGLLGLLILAAAAVVVILKSVDPREYADRATALVKEKTGRELTIAGKVDLKISLSPEIVAEKVAFANASWGSRKEMARVRRVEVEIALLPLFSGEVRLQRLILIEPDVLLEVDEKGRANWDFGAPAEAEAAPEEGPPPVRIGGVHLEKGRLAYHDRRTKKRTELVLAHADARHAHALTSDLELDIAGTLDAKPFSAKGRIGDPSAFFADNALNLDLQGRIPGASALVSGSVERPKSLRGFDLKLGLEVEDAPAAAGFFGAAAPRLPLLKVDARVRDRDGGQTVEPLRVALGKSELSGSVRIDRSAARPKVSARLAGPLVDLSQLAPAKSKAASERGDGRIFSGDPLPFGALKATDLDAEFKLDKLILPGGDAIEAVLLKAMLNNGRLKAEPASFTAAGGRVNARLDLDASSGKSAGLNLRAEGSGLSLSTLLAMAGKPQRVSGGPTDFRIEAAGSGGSVRGIMADLDGSARITVGEARIEGRGLDLGGDVLGQMADALNPARRSGSGTRLQCAVANVPVRNGVVTLDNRVGIETDQIGMMIEGSVNLGTEALDVAARSKAKQGIGAGLANFTGVARVQGTFANPSLGVDARGAAEAAATVGAAVTTGGMSLLYQGLFNKAFPEHPCQVALSGRAAETAPAAAPAKKKEPGLLDRLFGR